MLDFHEMDKTMVPKQDEFVEIASETDPRVLEPTTLRIRHWPVALY